MLLRSIGIFVLTLLCSFSFFEVADAGFTPFETLQTIELTDSNDAPENDKDADNSLTTRLKSASSATQSYSYLKTNTTPSTTLFPYYSQGPPALLA